MSTAQALTAFLAITALVALSQPAQLHRPVTAACSRRFGSRSRPCKPGRPGCARRWIHRSRHGLDWAHLRPDLHRGRHHAGRRVRPYHVGRGPNRPTKSGGTIGGNGVWDFDRFQGPFAPAAPSRTRSRAGGRSCAASERHHDASRTTGAPSSALDYGNQVNYVINQGSAQADLRRDRSLAPRPRRTPVSGRRHHSRTNVQPVRVVADRSGRRGLDRRRPGWGFAPRGDLSAIDAVANGGTGNPSTPCCSVSGQQRVQRRWLGVGERHRPQLPRLRLADGPDALSRRHAGGG